MQGITISSPTPSPFLLDKNEYLDLNPSQIDFQSKIIEDFELIPQKQTNHPVKFTFSPPIWTSQDERRLLELHKTFGNKWTSLSKNFEGSCQNSIKNRFYSRLRKSIRKLNKAIPANFGKKYPKFNLNIIFKLSNVSEGKVIGKCRVENQITTFYKDFIYKLIDYSEFEEQNVQTQNPDQSQEVEDFVLALIALENLFRIISGERVYKGKKKNIAYLKRFNFKLDNLSTKTLVISRENCYIVQGHYENEPHSARSSDCIQSFMGSQHQLSVNLEVEKIIDQDSRIQKAEEKTIAFEFCQKTLSIDSMSYTTDQTYPSSPYQSFLLDEELREYEMFNEGTKERWAQNLLDQYSGTKFNFDIEC